MRQEGILTNVLKLKLEIGFLNFMSVIQIFNQLNLCLI